MTLIPDEHGVINTYCTWVTEWELEMMSGEENLHELIDVTVENVHGENVVAKAYICKNLEEFVYPR